MPRASCSFRDLLNSFSGFLDHQVLNYLRQGEEEALQTETSGSISGMKSRARVEVGGVSQGWR